MRAAQDNPALTGLGGDFLERSAALGWYWLAALIGGYLLSLWWYRWHGVRVGVQTRPGPTSPPASWAPWSGSCCRSCCGTCSSTWRR
ncbi:hypothetical protein NKG94_35405 [Micromonospora sp. M12]